MEELGPSGAAGGTWTGAATGEAAWGLPREDNRLAPWPGHCWEHSRRSGRTGALHTHVPSCLFTRAYTCIHQQRGGHHGSHPRKAHHPAPNRREELAPAPAQRDPEDTTLSDMSQSQGDTHCDTLPGGPWGASHRGTHTATPPGRPRGAGHRDSGRWAPGAGRRGGTLHGDRGSVWGDGQAWRWWRGCCIAA